MNELKINSVSDLISSLKQSDLKGDFWFRGHLDKSWELVPSYYRKKNISEGMILKRFKQNAALLIDRHPEKSYDWLFWMQHHRIPTRLLDWTENSLVGLYFAVEDKSYDSQDGAFWILDPIILNKEANILNENDLSYIPSFENEEINNYTSESVEAAGTTSMKPVAIVATRNNRRIQAQAGVFTINHRDKTPIELIGGKKHLKKFIIPKKAKKEIRKELGLLGLHKFLLFPDLDNIVDIIIK